MKKIKFTFMKMNAYLKKKLKENFFSIFLFIATEELGAL